MPRRPAKSTKGPSYEEEDRALSGVTDFRSEEGRGRLLAGLRCSRSLVAARAARLVKEHHVDGFGDELRAAFDRFMRDPARSDPTCGAKLAAIEALDYDESTDEAPFVRAVAHVQFQSGNDVAAPLRARGVLALARLGHADFDLIAAKLVTDAIAPVRQAALDALAHRGDRANAALALVKLRLGDEDPLVTLAAMNALVALAPAHALAELAAILDDDAGGRAELAAVALGGSRSDEALTLLLNALGACTTSERREPILRGIGLHRSDRALEALLVVIAESHADDARAAIAALGPRRFEPGLAARVRRAAAASTRAELGPVVDELFGPDAPRR